MLDNDTVIARAAELKAAGKPFALVTVVRAVSPTSAKPGAKAVVEADGVIQGWVGGGCAQPAVIKTAKQAIADGQARLIRISPTKEEVIEEGIVDFGMTCHSGGTLDIFIDPVIARPALLVIGGSPAAQALCGLAQQVGFAVTVAFPDMDKDMFPEAAHRVDNLEPEVFAQLHTHFVVVATQGKRDEAGLEAALATGASYIAFIASARKAEKLKAYLKERGHEPARVDAILAPAGVEIDAETPEEIALSVLAGVVQARRSGKFAVTVPTTAVKAAGKKSSAAAAGCCAGGATAETSASATAIDPVCGMTVDTRTAEHRYEYQGKTYYFCCAGCQHSFAKTPEKFLAA
jgi:xanthine dehydrogenase accessory factor